MRAVRSLLHLVIAGIAAGVINARQLLCAVFIFFYQ